MKRFFDRPDTHWRRGNGALHLYATPGTGSTVAGVVKAAEPILSGMGALVAQPSRYVHMTLQRLDLYEDEPDDDGTAALRTSLATFARTAKPLTVRCGSPPSFAARRSRSWERIAMPSTRWSAAAERPAHRPISQTR